MKKILSLLMCVFMLLGMFTVSFAEDTTGTIQIIAEADTYAESGKGKENFGAATVVKALAKAGVTSRDGFLKFNLADFNGEDYVVEKAELSFYVTTATGMNTYFNIYRIENDSWTEGTSNNAKDSDANAITWNNSRSFLDNQTLVYAVDTKEKRPVFDTVTKYDLTECVKAEYEKDGILSLRFESANTSNNTWGLQMDTKENPNRTDAEKPSIILTVSYDKDKVAVVKDLENMELDIDGISENFYLPKTGDRGSALTWVSNSDAAVISDNGDNYLVTVYPDSTKNISFKLTATATSGAESCTMDYFGLIGVSTNIKAQKDYNALEAPAYSDEMATITFPNTGLVEASAITWESNNTDVITNDGKVLRPAFEDETVTLSATITDTDGVSLVKTFNYTVKALGYLVADKDTYISGSDKGSNCEKNYGKNVLLVTDETYRKAYMGFDLSKIPAGKKIKSATLTITRPDTNINFIAFNHVENDTWVEGDKTDAKAGDNELSTNHADAYAIGEKIAELRTGGSNKNAKYDVDVTHIVQKEAAGDKYLSMIFQKVLTGTDSGKHLSANNNWFGATGSKYPGTFHSSESVVADYNTDYRPQIKFEFAEDADEIKAVEALENIDLPAFAYGDIDIPTSDENGAEISWASDNEDYITSSGLVSPAERKDYAIKLTATATVNGKTATKNEYVEIRCIDNPYSIMGINSAYPNGNRVSVLAPNGTLKYVKLRKNYDADKDVTLIVALYADTTLLNVVQANVGEMAEGEIKNITTDMILPASLDGVTYKVFVLSADGSLIPYVD